MKQFLKPFKQYRWNFSKTTILKNKCIIPTSKNQMHHQAYDYLIIGAGSAGCVLANRLSSKTTSTVMLIESGPEDKSIDIEMPIRSPILSFNDKYNWNYITTPQQYMNDRTMYYPRGRVIGGSSSTNFMLHIRGHPFDYDKWEQSGVEGWSFSSCLPYFKKLECLELGDDCYRGRNGPIKVNRNKNKNILHNIWMKACAEAGYSFTDDFNGYRQEGFGYNEFTIHHGRRCSASKAYLNPIRKNWNVSILTETLVTKILFDHKRAVGVEILNKQGQLEKLLANREVILSGGAINSPQLLMLSGVGDGDELRRLSIDVVQHIPGVGKNLQDHPSIAVQHKCSKKVGLFSNQTHLKKVFNNVEWFLFNSGCNAATHFDSGAFIRSKAQVEHADIQLLFGPRIFLDYGRQEESFDAFQAPIILLRPKSKGKIILKSNDPRSHPVISLNMLSEEEDLFDMRMGIRLTREILSQVSFDEYRGEEISPGSHVLTDTQLDNVIRNQTLHTYHASCCCKMGSSRDNDSVVDNQCRVLGLDNIRVVDASIMPNIISGNTNAPTIMIAEKAADIILGNPSLPKLANISVWTPKFPFKQRE